MGLSGALLLLGELHFIEEEWAGLAKVPGVTSLKVRDQQPLTPDRSRVAGLIIRAGVSHW
jgi:hypothetical protein